jgi:hypothetical protein
MEGYVCFLLCVHVVLTSKSRAMHMPSTSSSKVTPSPSSFLNHLKVSCRHILLSTFSHLLMAFSYNAIITPKESHIDPVVLLLYSHIQISPILPPAQFGLYWFLTRDSVKGVNCIRYPCSLTSLVWNDLSAFLCLSQH